jgi:ADP-heptose:LPS heptosyltransferase
MKRRVDSKLYYWSLALSAVDRAAGLAHRPASDRKVLIVRPDALGDFLLWLNAAEEFRRLYPAPQYEITLLGNQIWTSLAGRLGYFDHVWDVNRKKFIRDLRYRYRLLKKVAAEGFSVVIYPVLARDFLWGDSIVHASGAPVLIGSAGDLTCMTPRERRFTDKWYTKLVEDDSQDEWEGSRTASFMRGFGSPHFKFSVPRLPAQAFDDPSSRTSKAYYVICPGTGVTMKAWPIESFASLADRIFDHTKWAGIVCGTASESSLAQQLLTQSHASLENRAGRTSLAELASIFRQARLVIANDSGSLHLAAATGTPVVAIVGGGQFGRFVPYREPNQRIPMAIVYNKMECFGCDWTCIYKIPRGAAAPCITSVTLESVWASVRALLKDSELSIESIDSN